MKCTRCDDRMALHGSLCHECRRVTLNKNRTRFDYRDSEKTHLQHPDSDGLSHTANVALDSLIRAELLKSGKHPHPGLKVTP